MAEEVEEPFSINLQADSIHSGSISFGRFENEPLSWERRSSFSHNRYLEEVEKFSKPGSVIEKKAYFEAHFKKRGPSGIFSSVRHDGSDQTNSENGGSEKICDLEDVESNKDGHHVQFDQRSQDDFEPYENGHFLQSNQRFQEDFGQNEDIHYVQVDESPSGSNYHGKWGLTECERDDAFREGLRVSISNAKMKYDINNSNVLEDVIDRSITLNEADRAENEISNMLPVSFNDASITEMRKSCDDTVNTDEPLRTENISVTEAAGGVEETTMHNPINSSPKETMPEPGANSSFNNVRIRRMNYSKLFKDSWRSLGGESSRRTNMENNISKLATSTTHSVSRTPKGVSRSVEKVIRESKSEKVSRMKKASESQPSVLKADTRGVQEAERLSSTFKSAKSDPRPMVAAFKVKSRVPTERRKELEEKSPAKEVEMNQMQGISQVKKDAEIKKLRKSLNFKATPMPSFYRTALPSKSDGNKAVSNSTRSKKVQKPKCRGSDAEAASLPSNMRAANDQAVNKSVALIKPHSISAEESPSTTDASEACLFTPALPTNQRCLSNTNNQSSGNKERAKATFQNHRVSTSCKEAERHSNEGKQKGETPKYSNEIGKQGIKSKRSSGIGNLPVRVAS